MIHYWYGAHSRAANTLCDVYRVSLAVSWNDSFIIQ